MAPGRKRANKLKTVKKLSLGDLVLAKVKGFPAWPAKVSRPEDWERASDPKKYFVYFFGTQEIAFVGPADIQEFTSESKSKLLTRCKGKAVRYFAQAVKEICDAFEELQGKNSSDETNKVIVPCDASNNEGMEVDGRNPDMGQNCETIYETEVAGVSGNGFDQKACSNKQDRTGDTDNKLSSMSSEDDRSSLAFFKNTSNEVDHVEEVKGVPTESKNKAHGSASCELVHSARASSFSPYSGLSDVKQEAGCGLMSCKENNNSIRPSAYSNILVGRPKLLVDGDNSNDLNILSKRKLDRLVGDVNKSSTHVYDGRKNAVGGKTAELLTNDIKSESNVDGKKVKKLLGNKRSAVSKNSHKDVVTREHMGCDKVRHPNSARLAKHTVKDRCNSSKTTKHVDCMIAGSIFNNGKNDLEALHVAEVKSVDISGTKITVDCKADDHSRSKSQEGALGHDISGDKEELPFAKRRRQVTEVYISSSMSGDKKSLISGVRKTESKSRRAIYLGDGEIVDVPKTPVHGGSSHKLKASACYSTKTSNENHRRTGSTMQTLKVSAECGDVSRQQPVLSAKSHIDSSRTLILARSAETSDASIATRSPRMLELKNQSFDEPRVLLTSLKTSPRVCGVSSEVADEQKAEGHGAKASIAGTQVGTQVISDKCSSMVSDALSSCPNHIFMKKSRQPTGGEKLKGTQKMVSHFNVPALPLENEISVDLIMGGRMEDLDTDKTSLLVDSKMANSALSMKHLIAAAQAKRRQAQMQNLSHDSTTFFTPSADTPVRSPSPLFPGQLFVTDASNTTELSLVGTCSRGNYVSPLRHASPSASQSALQNQLDAGEHDGYNRVSSGPQATGVSLGGGTEAAVARDAFEGMIETLSRTKESIGRATRLAVDCAKYGIANEVVDLLVRKLEREPSFHRRVDLFFLVDSITQCSHSQKGLAGALYIPAVQATLTRILEAVAPSGSSARENRRQCLKVLRLWLKRNILPESILRRHIETIEEMSRHPSRNERAVDDPIREMEGMLVNEYGSNATFQLPGLLSLHAFDNDEDEDDSPSTSCKKADYESAKETINISEEEINAGKVTRNDSDPHILESVEVEHEMDDVTWHQKDEGTLPISGAIEIDSQKLDMDLTVHHEDEILSLNGSPPLPLESPPPLPPLPSSPLPPPPPPPPLSPSLPRLHPPPPQPQHLLQPPPPPPPPLYSAPQRPGQLAPALPCQQSFSPQVLQQPASALPPSQVMYQTHASHEHCRRLTGNQLAMQQSPCFLPAGRRDNSSRQLEYGHREAYVNVHATQSNQLFQPGHAQFGLVHLNQNLPRPAGGQFPYGKPTVRPHFPQPYVQPFSSSSSLPSLADGCMQFYDEQWKASCGEIKADINQHRALMNGGRAPVITNSGGEGCLRPSERPPSNNMVFQISASNPLQNVPPPGHASNQMLPCRPDMSALNCHGPV